MDKLIYHCGVLGVTPESNDREIKLAYRELARLVHPDRHQNCAIAKRRFQEITQSYQLLTIRYDARQAEPKAKHSPTSSQATQYRRGPVQEKNTAADAGLGIGSKIFFTLIYFVARALILRG